MRGVYRGSTTPRDSARRCRNAPATRLNRADVRHRRRRFRTCTAGSHGRSLAMGADRTAGGRAAGFDLAHPFARFRRRTDVPGHDGTVRHFRIRRAVAALPGAMWSSNWKMYPSRQGLELVWEALRGAYPSLAPGTMIMFGLLGLVACLRHPALHANPESTKTLE